MKLNIVFGGAGFIGTNLVLRLNSLNEEVLIIDNLETGQMSNVEMLVTGNELNKFFLADIATEMQLIERYITSFLTHKKYDEIKIFNLACPASPPKYQINPLHTIKTSLAINEICELAFKLNAKVLHTSTSEVYGNPNVPIQTEEYSGNVNCIGPRSCYDEGKRCAETILYEWRKLGLDCKIIRIFNTYGPYMDIDDGRVITNFIKQYSRNEDVTIYGNGLQTRSFQYIDDLINGIISVMDSSEPGPFNIGNPEEYTIKELAEKIKDKFPNSTSKIIYCDLPVDDPIQRCPSIRKMTQTFGWRPKTKLDAGLNNTIHYFLHDSLNSL